MTVASCLMCHETIDCHFDGLPAHRECLLLSTVGHMWGLCGCTGYGGMTYRAAGIELDRRIAAREKPAP